MMKTRLAMIMAFCVSMAAPAQAVILTPGDTLNFRLEGSAITALATSVGGLRDFVSVFFSFQGNDKPQSGEAFEISAGITLGGNIGFQSVC